MGRYDPTIEDSYKKTMNLDGEAVRLDLLDTAGQQEYQYMQDKYIASGEGFVLVFSLINAESLEEVKRLHDAIRKRKGAAVPIV